MISRNAVRALGRMTALALCFSTYTVSAEIYKWVDENNRTVFSEKPPPGTAKEVVKPRISKNPANPVSPATAAPAADAQPKKPETPPAPTAKQKAQMKKACEEAHVVMNQLTISRRMQYVNDKNELAFVTEEDRQARLKEAEKAIKDYCNVK